MTFFTPFPRTPAPQSVARGPRSRATSLALACALAGVLPLSAWGQAAPPAPEESPRDTVPKTERIVHEDGGSRVQELKVGGQTRQIEVQTKADMPAYQINPTDAAQGPANPDGQRTGTSGSAGRTIWRVLSF